MAAPTPQATPDAAGPLSHGGELREGRAEPEGFVALVGAGAIELGRTGKELYSVFVRTLYYCVYGRKEPGAVLAQMPTRSATARCSSSR
jgi:phospholipid/cholesterol/gamma-HCH transport system permease protein